VKAGLEKEKAALMTVSSGYRESKDSWAEVLRELVARGMNVSKRVVADGHLGLWVALLESQDEERGARHERRG
jgi:transposase-like protein